jgi:hypothetical protein
MGVELRPCPSVLTYKIYVINLRPLQKLLEGPYLYSLVSVYQGAVRRISGSLVEASDEVSV